MSQEIRVAVVDNTSENPFRHEVVTEGATVGDVIQTILDGMGDEVTVRYNRIPADKVDADQPVGQGDRVTISPAKVEGGNA